jgi:Secretion system C-terminal sorting domain
LPFLPDKLEKLDVSKVPSISCLPNKPLSLQSINLPICDSKQCFDFPNITGKVFWDIDSNGIYDINNDSLIKEINIKSSEGLYDITDYIGMFNFLGDTLKTYTYTPIVNNTFFKIVPQSRTVATNATKMQLYENLDFAIQSLSASSDLGVSITSGNASPGFESVSTLTYKNIGNTLFNGIISVTIDEKQTFVSANVLPTSQNGKILTWMFTDLKPFEYESINFILLTNRDALLNTTVSTIVKGSLLGVNDVNAENNEETSKVQVRGSYDPNDIQVDKKDILTITKIEKTPLIYTIRFQNTGNAEALSVEVLDTITKKLDASAIEMLCSSHSYKLSIVSDNGKVKDYTVLKWSFEDINLPDSSSNEKESHGFIKFRLKNDIKSMALTTDSIFNRAAIYFDFNQPIITNKVRTLFTPSLSTGDIKDLGLKIYPNPTMGIITISNTNGNIQNINIDIFNINGQLMQTQILLEGTPELNIQNLSEGLYFLRITSGKGTAVTKIIKI